METYYHGKNLSNFKEVVVTSVSRGATLVKLSDNTVEEMRLSSEVIPIYSIAPRAEGVSVTHEVVLAIPNNVNSDLVYDDDFNAVEDALQGLIDCENCPFTVIAPPILNKTEVDLQSLCERFVDNADVAEFYEPVNVTGKIACVTVCNILHTRFKLCQNEGVCRIYSNVGPLCHCQHVESTWYLGDDCNFPIHKIPFFIGLSLTLCCLLLTVIGLTLGLLVTRHKQQLKRDFKETQVNQWISEDFQWSRANTNTFTSTAGDYINRSFTHDMDPDSRRSQRAHGYNAPSSTAGNSQSSSIPLRDFPSNQSMRTWDV
ncbi:mucin-17-like [Cottoperca gobio]|uniref:Mucin-17-like n=1 Tax=Cottoperca gobio TaxID=56716 RepID=A0A6J2RM29_COTGO|nr:mucin-17-like [Cottoperca gobio]